MPNLFGTGANQVPLNSMLGSLAYQDKDRVVVDTANVTQLNATNASITNISYSGTLTGGTGVINIGSGQIYKDAVGNVGIGAIPSSWSIYKVLQVGTYANVSYNSGFSIFGTNAYYNGSAWTYQSTNRALDYYQDIGSGSHVWRYASSDTGGTTITWSNVMELNSNRDLILPGTGATKVQEGTTAQRPASPQEGMIRKNSTLGVIEGYSGGGYVSLEAGRLIARTVYSTPGSYTWTPSTKTKYAILILISGGGGSGGCPPTTASQASISIPGSPGQFVRCEIPREVSLGGSYSVTVGAAGAGGTGSASPTNGVNGGVTIVQNNTDSSFISITGGWSGAAGYATTVFPETVSNVGPSSINNSGGHFVVLERNHTIFVQGVLFGTNGNNWNDNPSIAPCVAANPKSGVGGLSRILAASSAAANGNSGGHGEVIIYEYS